MAAAGREDTEVEVEAEAEGKTGGSINVAAVEGKERLADVVGATVIVGTRGASAGPIGV